MRIYYEISFKKTVYKNESIQHYTIFYQFFFWLLIAIFYSFVKENSNSMINFLLFMEPIIFLIAFIGYLKRNIIIYYLTLVFLFCNAILSITDELGFQDILSLVLNLLLFIILAFQWRIFRQESHKKKYIKDMQ